MVSPSAIALDVGAGKMYRMDFDAKNIQRVNLDCSQVEDVIIDLPSSPLAIVLDTALGGCFGATLIPTSFGVRTLMALEFENLNPSVL